MKLTPSTLLNLSTAILFVSLSAFGQMTVDATGPTHAGWQNVRVGRGGGIGRKLPLQLRIELYGTPFNGTNGRTVLEFILTNTSHGEFTIPVSPDPDSVRAASSFKNLWLFVTSDERHQTVLQGGPDPKNPFINLYGSAAVPGTVATLHPGESIHVRAEVALPHPAGESDLTVFVAHAAMDEKTIAARDGRRFMDSYEIGSTTSDEYHPEALFNPPK